MKVKLFLFILIITTLWHNFSLSQVEYRTDWPKVADLKKVVTINALSKNIYHKIPIYDRTGKVVYTLYCHGGSTEYLDKLSDSTGNNYVGPLCFILVEGEKDGEGSLLSEDGSASWYSRGQLHDYKNIVGACGKYPEYGNLRHFRLRGFELTLHFINIKLGKDAEPIKFDVEVTVHPDANITSSYTEQTGYLTPYKKGCSCNKILKGNEPRMFRNKNGDWVDEKELVRQKKH